MTHARLVTDMSFRTWRNYTSEDRFSKYDSSTTNDPPFLRKRSRLHVIYLKMRSESFAFQSMSDARLLTSLNDKNLNYNWRTLFFEIWSVKHWWHDCLCIIWNNVSELLSCETWLMHNWWYDCSKPISQNIRELLFPPNTTDAQPVI